MKPKFELGEDVHVDFIGKVKEVKTLDTKPGELFYSLTTKDILALDVPESCLTRLEQPEDFSSEKPAFDHDDPGHERDQKDFA